MAQKTIDFESDILEPIGSLKRDLADLKDNKITKFYTNNNGDTVLNDSDDGKIQDLMVYGKSEQKQYKGTNLAVTEYQRTPFVKDGVTFIVNDDGSVTLNGTSTADNIDFYLCGSWTGSVIVNLDADKDYTIKAMPIEGIEMYFGTYTRNKSVAKTNVHTKGMPLAFIFIRILKAGITCNNVVIYPSINEGTTLLDYEPYTGGKPSPSPEYPQEIKAVVNPVIKTHGKNLVDFRKAKGGNGDGVTFTVNADGSINRKGTAIGNVGNVWFLGRYGVTEPKEDEVIITLKKGKTYYVTDCILFGVEHGSTASYKGYGTVIKPIKNEVKITAIRNADLVERTTYNDTIHPMIVESEATVDWQTYQESQATLPYELNAIPVSSGGNVTIDGQQYIADYVDIEKGVLVRNVKKGFLKSFQWLKAINNGVARFYASMFDALGINNNKIVIGAPAISSHFIRVTSTPDRTGTFILNADGTSANIGFAFSTDTTISSDEFNNWILKNKPFVFIQVLKEEVPLTSEQIQAFKALVTYYPKTYVTTESEQLNAYTMFNYPVSMEKGWEYVKQQIGDTRKYVYDMDLQSAEAYVNSEYAVALTELEV